MAGLTKRSFISPHILITTERGVNFPWSVEERKKSIYQIKPSEIRKMSDFKPIKWDLLKQKTERRGTETRKTSDRKMSDRAQIMEWLERRQGKSLAAAHKKENYQLGRTKQSLENLKHLQDSSLLQEEKKLRKLLLKPTRENQLDDITSIPNSLRNSLRQTRRPSEESSGSRDSVIPKIFSSYLNTLKDANKKLLSDPDTRDNIFGPEVVLTATPRMSMPRRNTVDPTNNQFVQDPFSISRKGTIPKIIDPSVTFQVYDRKIKNLTDRTPVRTEHSTLLKPHEVLSCRYLRLSKNNIQTLLRLCKEAGMDIDIHPHMRENEMDANRIFSRRPTIAL